MISKRLRVVVRKSGRDLTVQLVQHSTTGDATVAAARAVDLKKLGYKGGTGNIPAAYLTGCLFANRALAAGYSNGVLDMGLNANSRGSRIYAAVLGALEGGFDIPFDREPLPPPERARGEHIAAFADANPARFSRYGIDPKELPDHVDSMKREILDGAARKAESVKTVGKHHG
jgi:large subunit ribosomal protein L18